MANQTQGKQTAVIMGKNPDGENVFLQTDADGALKTTTSVEIEIKNDEGNALPVTLSDVAAKDISTQVAGGDVGLVTNSVIHGKTTAGGGSYVDVKVTPSGALSTNGEVLIKGVKDDGSESALAITNENHLEVSVHEPIDSFNQMMIASLTPVFQGDGVYSSNQYQYSKTETLSGTVSVSGNIITAATGATQYAQGVLYSRKRMKYRPGQAIVARFTAMFSAPASYAYTIAGIGTAESGVYVGYAEIAGNTPSFGILHVTGGVRAIYTLTVTTGATSAGNVTITLNGTANTVAVTNSSNIQRTVWEISQGTYSGWTAAPSGATVVFVRTSAGATAGAFSFSAGTTGSAASIAQTVAGAASTDTFTPQASWNGDKLDGTGSSGVTIDPTKLNIFQFMFGYLGADSVVVRVKVTLGNSNNPTFVTVHSIPFLNARAAVTFSQPSFPFTLAAYSAGSTTNITVGTGSWAGFISGVKQLHGPRQSYRATSTSVAAASITALFTIFNPRSYSNRANQVVVNLVSLTTAVKHTQPVTLFLIRNGALTGNPNFAPYSTVSAARWDTAATVVSYSTNDQLVFSLDIAETGDKFISFQSPEYNGEEFTLQPGEWLTVGARTVQNTAAFVSASLNTREDQ